MSDASEHKATREWTISFEKGYDNPNELIQVAIGPSVGRAGRVTVREVRPGKAGFVDAIADALKYTTEQDLRDAHNLLLRALASAKEHLLPEGEQAKETK